VLKNTSGEHPRDFFETQAWQDYVAALSERLGLSLRVYSSAGKCVFKSRNHVVLCQNIRSSTPGSASSCETYCLPLMMNTLISGKSDVFKCHFKIACFAMPVIYRNKQSVILGQASFPSLEDFREGIRLARKAGIDTSSQRAPLRFTSLAMTRKLCGFVQDTLCNALGSSRETPAPGKALTSANSIMAVEERARGVSFASLINGLKQELRALINTDDIAIFVQDESRKHYACLTGQAVNSGTGGTVSVADQSEIVQNLMAGRPFVISTGPAPFSTAGAPQEQEVLRFFPVIADNVLEAVLCIADKSLKEGDAEIVAMQCRQTALSMENHHLRQELYLASGRYSVISELTQAITSIHNYDTLLKDILEKSAHLLRAEQGSLMLLDHQTDELLFSARKGFFEGLSGQLRIRSGEGIAGRVAEFGETMLVKDLEYDHRTMQKNRQNYKTRSFVSVPLKVNNRIIGVLNLSDKTTGEVFNEDDLITIQSFATNAAIVMDRTMFQHKSEELEKLTVTDHLTGLANRKYFFDRLKEELARSERHGHHLCLLMVDLDGFKRCNDTRGHLFGDKVLKNMAATLAHTIRSIDIAARFGGDEFIVILPETDEPVAIEIAERVRENMSKSAAGLFMNGDGDEQKMITASIGIACYPEHGSTIEHLLGNADTALYRAKNRGKNRIEVFRDIHGLPVTSGEKAGNF